MKQKAAPGTPALTPEQKLALDTFAAKNGRTWRAKLRALWFNGRDAELPNGAYLRQVRNQQPPSFLAAYRPGA